MFNLPSGVSASHIHVGEFSGTVKDTEFLLRPDQGIRSADDMFQAILGGNAYVNVHSAVNPGGEIRGQLVMKP